MTKQYDQTQAAAQQIVSAFGIEYLDSLPVTIRRDYLVAMCKHLMAETGVVYQTARNHIAKACTSFRYPHADISDQRGGQRDGSGRPTE